MKNLQITKFPVIVRSDIPTEHQAVQISHAALQFQHQHSDIAKLWHDTDNRLVFLSVKNEEAILELKEKAAKLNIPYSLFLEPDMGHQYTAIALAPLQDSRVLTKDLKLANFKKQ